MKLFKLLFTVVAALTALAYLMQLAPRETKVLPKEIASPARITVRIPEHNEPANIYSEEVPLSNGWQCWTQDLCRRYGIDYALMLGLMETESSFRLGADSGWAYGVCQIGYINADWLADEGVDIFTTSGNIEAACIILSDYLSRYTTDQALMAYNQGEYGASEDWDSGIYQSDYSRSVQEAAEKWRNIINDRS